MIIVVFAENVSLATSSDIVSIAPRFGGGIVAVDDDAPERPNRFAQKITIDEPHPTR